MVSTGTNNADGKIVMDSVTYTAAGEHTYTLRETKASTTENGITYSTAEYTIVTIVKDNGDAPSAWSTSCRTSTRRSSRTPTR